VDPAILLIIVFIVAPLIERLLKAGKQNPQLPPPQQRIPQRPRQRLPHEQQPEEWEQDEQEQQAGGYRAESRGDPAAEMLPDDLWEILTGERRPRPGPRPAPGASLPREFDYTQEEEGQSLEGRSLEDEGLLQTPSEVQSSGEWSTEPATLEVVLPAEPYIRPNPVRLAPKVVSLEEIDFDYDQRHDEFHDMLDSLDGPARVKRPALSPYRFKSNSDLRRSIVMAEVLGKPRGLE
jgi:hypothetical protein